VPADPADLSPGPAPLVLARGVSLRFPGGLLALDDVDLELRRGELVTVVGPSGCGKSTLLRAVAGLLPISSGTLTVAGLAPDAARRAWGRQAFVFQDATLLPWRSVRDNVRLPLELRPSSVSSVPHGSSAPSLAHGSSLPSVPHGSSAPSLAHGSSAPDPEAAVDRVLALVGLRDFADTYPAELSGGMRMRASLARALVTRPELLLLDEPFGALDELARERLNQELLGLWQRDGFAALAVTHSLAEAVLLADRVLVLRPRPGRVAHVLTIDLPRPRPPEIQTTPAFTALLAALRARIQEST
jgi:NitT/TauT family transport system ATP-binding protein